MRNSCSSATDVRCADGGIDGGAVAKGGIDGDVVGRAGPEGWRAGREGVEDVGHGRQDCVVDLDQVGSVSSGKGCLGDHHRDGFARIADEIHGQQGAATLVQWPMAVQRTEGGLLIVDGIGRHGCMGDAQAAVGNIVGRPT